MNKSLLLLAITLAFAKTVSIKELATLLNKNESPLEPKEFNLVLLLKNLKNDDLLKGFKSAKIEGKEQHELDIITQLVQYHKKNGGKYEDAYIVTKDKDANTYMKEMMLGFNYFQKSSTPFRFSRHGKGDFWSNKKTLNSCLGDNGVGVELREDKERPGYVTVEARGKSVEVELEDFYKNGLFEVLLDACKVVELSKMQERDFKRNLFVLNFEKLGSLLEGKHAEIAEAAYGDSIKAVTKNLEKVYPKDSINMLHVVYKPSEEPTPATRRVLEETVVTVQAQQADENAMYSMKFGFTIATFWAYFFICVEIFRMKVYKDSLVYSSFLTTKKSD